LNWDQSVNEEDQWYSKRMELIPEDKRDKIKSIKGEGNCFYRALAQQLYGSQSLYK